MVTEESPTRPQSPYARSKLITEMMLEDMAAAYGFKAVALRYFNPIGADPMLRSGQAQPSPTQIVNVLVDVARGARPTFQVTGTDWPTRDGTGIRDYVHVWDIAEAHVKTVGADGIDLRGRRWVHRHQPGDRGWRDCPRGRSGFRARTRLGPA